MKQRALQGISGMKGALLDALGGRVQSAKKRSLSKGPIMPPVMMVLPYLMSILTFFITSYFLLLYGLSFTPEMEAEWLDSVAVGLVQELILQQFLKITLLGFLQAVILPSTFTAMVMWAGKAAELSFEGDMDVDAVA
uniref:Uncharacterized protein n=2 Tax=Palpitomonas bilix TaxID=652834 RepID=A0A7S3CV71_9EUKA|mmetsp:Transcript_10322/g.27063  ORF Transcript_10322/g.27063 Transcript_10322/m.27063 type:complete len:137 (+) Transcript_10322:231-641(+)